MSAADFERRMRAHPTHVVEIAKRMPDRMRESFVLRSAGFRLSEICARMGITRAALDELLCDAVLQLDRELPLRSKHLVRVHRLDAQGNE